MALIIDGAGDFAMRQDGKDPFRALARAIIFQQLSGLAAGTIYRRFLALFDEPGAGRTQDLPGWSHLDEPFPAPALVLALTDETMRGAGLSRQKSAALRSLAEHFATGELGAEPFATLDDEAIVERLTRVRGVGRWTAEMFLMFHELRPDVLPVDDIGLQKAVAHHYHDGQRLPPRELRAFGAQWAPYRSVATWYLWRWLDPIPVEY